MGLKMHKFKYENQESNDLWWVSVSGSHPTTLSSSPTQLLVGQLTRLPFHSGYATEHRPNWLQSLLLPSFNVFNKSLLANGVILELLKMVVDDSVQSNTKLRQNCINVLPIQ